MAFFVRWFSWAVSRSWAAFSFCFDMQVVRLALNNQIPHSQIHVMTHPYSESHH